ncbi:hypothetical protein VP1G_00949 [Cytospora mali]|uniref:Uncharacterized protein n=1 Tax=Cytospora mali TaxID=578113 RepID=A0A194UPS7_CYTMA|nr:hypothetical protein VP1G_00949 [Valsa mali var. pyri (nom. inval.)]
MASTTASEPSLSPPPQPPNDIDISGIPALVSWDLADGTTEYLQAVPDGSSSSLCRPKLHILYETASGSVLFKLRLSVLLKSHRNKSKNTAQFFVFIPPENIATLSAITGQEPPETIRNILSAGTVCLRFALNTPPTVVAPPSPDRIVPKNDRNAGVLASLLGLARQTHIAVHISHRVLDQPRLRTLCTAASSDGLPSFDHHGIATLYGGRGGRILEASSIDSPSEAGAYESAGLAAADSPPSYDELGPGPPPAVEAASLAKIGQASRKRPRRTSSDSGSSSPSPRCGGEGAAKKQRDGSATRETGFYVDDMEKPMEHAEITEKTEHKEQMERIERMEQRLAARLDRRLDSFEQLIKEQLQEHKRSITEMVEERMEAHEEQTQLELDLLRREVESDVEEQLIGKKAELDDQFKDERLDIQETLEERFAELEESITQRFSSARAVLEFD